jgi:PAP2 superfamily
MQKNKPHAVKAPFNLQLILRYIVVRCSIFLLLCTCRFGFAATILAYPDLQVQTSANLILPQSVFHEWELSNKEATQVIASWKNDVVTIPWTRIQLAMHVKHKTMPTRAARGLALVHVAMHDAFEQAMIKGVDPKFVVSMAAAQVLSYLYIAEEKAFDRIAISIAAQLSNTTPETLPDQVKTELALGQRIGETVVKYGDSDGAQKGWNGLRLQYYGEGRYYGPGTWEPTPPYFYYPPDEPYAPSWRTWVLSSSDEFRPIPPAYGSKKYIIDLEEVRAIAASLSAEQIKIARFWVDGHGSVTPAGHWNQIAIDAISNSNLDAHSTTRLFAYLNIAMADVFIAAWDAKYYYWTARPITAAKHILGAEHKPLLLTPPFPSYVSGHAAFSGSAAKVLGFYLPKRSQFFDAMAEEASNSRLLGGIHFRHDNDDGLILGRKVADKVLKTYAIK